SAMRSVVKDSLKDTMLRLLQETNILSDSRELELAFVLHDYQAMKNFAKRAMQRCKANFATIVDAKGVVLARGHSAKTGDNIADRAIIQKALAGQSVVDVVMLLNNGLSLGAASPVYLNSEVVGAVLFGDSFKTNAFVDEIKKVTGLEMTVFDQTTRLSTTIMRHGERMIGTKLENPKIITDVLEHGEIFQDDTQILGLSYKTIYWPIENKSGQILGMWFLGTEVESSERLITNTALSCLLATLVIATALSFFGVLFFRTVIRPLEQKAYYDLLTGITNRAGFERKIQKIFATPQAGGVLFLLDLDHFKELNDSLGHPKGDSCLKRTGRILSTSFRTIDLVARLGGDEFIVYCPSQISLEAIETRCKNLLRELRKDYKLASGETLTVTASLGVALCHAKELNFEQLYLMADDALYKSKEEGRDCYTIYDCPDHDLKNCQVRHGFLEKSELHKAKPSA
ncbi:MAG: diguanylate cyclase, partial [Desulfovibrio sp.]|nr:diguanylate cyclase [Desulfovibrio sp.]